MRLLAFAILCTAFVSAQAPPPASPVACGPGTVGFKVKLDDTQHTVASPDPTKARIYFIHDAGTGSLLGYPTVKLALDGSWLGANHGNSYFSVLAEPGEHHICVTLQSSLVGQRVELAHLTAEADKIYYYRTRLVLSRSVDLLVLELIDSDQGRYLIASFPLSVSQRKK